MKQQYREWASTEEDIPIFAQPRWLDCVASQWEVEKGNGYWWPYVPRKKFGMTVSTLPSCTRYLGPLFTANGLPEDLPKAPEGVDYIVYTSHNPLLGMRRGGHIRAMASLTLDLTAPLRYSKTPRQELNQAIKKGIVLRNMMSSDLPMIKRLVEDQAHKVPADFFQILERSIRENLGICKCCYENDQLAGIAWIVFDKKTSYLLVNLRAPNSSKYVGVAIVDSVIQEAKALGCSTFNFCSGYIPGVRRFFQSLGGRPAWYGQVRAANGLIPSIAELCMNVMNSNRL